MPALFSGPYEELRLQTSLVCDWWVPSKRAISVGFLFLRERFTLGENRVISTKPLSPGPAE